MKKENEELPAWTNEGWEILGFLGLVAVVGGLIILMVFLWIW
jgi:hypothetical protein